jgi:hypothetical protein
VNLTNSLNSEPLWSLSSGTFTSFPKTKIQKTCEPRNQARRSLSLCSPGSWINLLLLIVFEWAVFRKKFFSEAYRRFPNRLPYAIFHRFSIFKNSHGNHHTVYWRVFVSFSNFQKSSRWYSLLFIFEFFRNHLDQLIELY